MNIDQNFINEVNSKINNANKILLQTHKNPDPDSVGAVLAWYEHLKTLNKEIQIICPTEVSEVVMNLFPESEMIEKVDFQKFNFSDFDLFILNDTASINQLTGYKEIVFPEIETIVIDHHKSNDLNHPTRLVVDTAFATGQILLHLFKELKIEITSKIATYFYAGIFTDTYGLTDPELDGEFFHDLAEIVDFNADVSFVINNLQKNNSLPDLRAISEILKGIVLESSATVKFAWVYVNPELNDKYSISYHDLKDKIADEIINTVEDTKFGIVLYKSDPASNKFGISIRARTEDVDSSALAARLGGGGHKSRAGASIEAYSELDAMRKIISKLELDKYSVC